MVLQWIPDSFLKAFMAYRMRKRLRLEKGRFSSRYLADYVQALKQSPITIEIEAANTQHYEVPTLFFDLTLGTHKKYSCCWFDTPQTTLDEAEEAMLLKYCERAQLQDGQTILELGCGWGSFTLFAAKRYPNSSITAISNSKTQREYILNEAKRLLLSNITIITTDVAKVEISQTFDRIISIEMLEHIRNYDAMFKKMAGWLNPEGLVFVHVFGHETYPYTFDKANRSSWTAQHVFSGGQMPSRALFSYFDQDLKIESFWEISGLQYARTAQCWLDKLKSEQAKILNYFTKVYGAQAKKQLLNWKLFYMLCVVLFGFNNGEDWKVFHYVFRKK